MRVRRPCTPAPLPHRGDTGCAAGRAAGGARLERRRSKLHLRRLFLSLCKMPTWQYLQHWRLVDDPTDLKLLLRFLDIKGSPKPTTRQFNWVFTAVRGCTSICCYPLALPSGCLGGGS
jgi:hypothetical protein